MTTIFLDKVFYLQYWKVKKPLLVILGVLKLVSKEGTLPIGLNITKNQIHMTQMTLVS